MLQFAVTVKGMEDGKARWVLAVQGNRLLIVEDDRSLKWCRMEDCKLAKLLPPDAPQPVIAVTAKQPGFVLPHSMQGRANGL